MGLFDEVEIEYPLGVDVRYKHFQTKSFEDPGLSHYRVDGDGQLWFRERWDDDWALDTYTGAIRMYGDNKEAGLPWKEFTLLFIRGKVVHIEEAEDPQ